MYVRHVDILVTKILNKMVYENEWEHSSYSKLIAHISCVRTGLYKKYPHNAENAVFHCSIKNCPVCDKEVPKIIRLKVLFNGI